MKGQSITNQIRTNKKKSTRAASEDGDSYVVVEAAVPLGSASRDEMLIIH